MKELFYILFLIVIVFAALFAVCLIVMFVYTGYRVLTGKVSPEEFKYHEEQVKKRKEEKFKKAKGSTHWLSYPSPLNNWGLWN